MKDNSSEINIEDFIRVYPPLPNKNTISLASNKFSNFFSYEKAYRRNSILNDKRSSKFTNNYSIDDINPNNNYHLNSIKEKTNINHKKDIDLSKKYYYSNDRLFLDSEKSEYYLLYKGIEYQNMNRKKTNDIKKGLGLFFRQSNLILKIYDFFNKYGLNKDNVSKTNKNKKESCIMQDMKDSIIENKIKLIIQKLVENSYIEKYLKNELVVKMNDIGSNWYFLISGRLSILKPILYDNIKVTYESYFKYFLSLIQKKEFFLAKQIIDLNKNFINVYSIDNLLEIIKVYCLFKVRNMIRKIDEKKIFTINQIEIILKEFNMSLSDIKLDKKDIILYLEKLNEEYELNSEFKINKAISQYLLKITAPTKEDILIYKTYNFLFKEQNEANNMTNFVTLGKYEIFLYLEPGAFFGESALENNYRRNASIRTEEKCFIISLNRELYNEIFLEINKRLKLEDVEFICSNYFFSNISPVIFNKYYYSMLILVNKKKNDIIYTQDAKISSIYLLKEGSIKYEIYVSILDINEIIKVLIKNLIKNKKILKIEYDVLNDIKRKYILNKKLFNTRNQNQTLNVELRKKYKYEISSCEKYEVMGIIEFFMHMNCINSCYVSSPEVKLFEINRHSLDKILYNERDILDSYYTLVYSKVISVIKRLNSIETYFINQIKYKIIPIILIHI